MRYLLSSFATFAVMWLLLSGHYTVLHISLGAASCGVVLLLASRMAVLDAESQPWHLHVRLVRYWGWLLSEITRANIDVSRRILAPRLPIRPGMMEIPTHEKTELGQTIFANSITLTPGTVAVSLLYGTIEVHALDSAGADDLVGGEMDRRVRAVETEKAASP